MVKGDSMKLYCYKCGVEDPEHEVNEYLRDCKSCGGDGSVMTLTELLDIVNDLQLKGVLKYLGDYVDEEFDKPELDFDNDEAIRRAEEDAISAYLEDEYGV